MKNKIVILVILRLLCFNSSFAQKALTGNEAADWVQTQRVIADSLIDLKSTTVQIQEGVQILNKALLFLDSLPIRELALSNSYLWYRRSDVNRDMASGYALLHQKDAALDALDRMYANGATSAVIQFLENDSTLDDIRKEPRYRDIIKKLTNQGSLWKNIALKTPYKANLSVEEKVAGLSLLWSQAKYNFVHFDNINLDWNQTYLDFIPQVMQTRTTADYYKVLIRFYALLKDGHTNVYIPDTLAADFYSRPPVRTQLIEGRVFITRVFSDSLYKTGIVPGLEILSIDGESVISYAENKLKPFLSSSTHQDMEVREFSYALLTGPEKKPVLLQCRDTKGNTLQFSVGRSDYRDVKGVKSIDYKTIGGIGYIAINNFEDQTILKQFDSLYTEIRKTKGLIIDLRYNGGGDGGLGFNIIGRLTDKPFLISDAKVLKHFSKPSNEPDWEDYGVSQWRPNGKICYQNPVVVLIGPRTFSAAEDFAVAFDYMKRGKLIGLPTGGSTGQPVFFNLPGGGSARVCGKNDTYPDGKVFVGIGIQPDISVKPTIKDLLNGKDATVEKALEVLNK